MAGVMADVFAAAGRRALVVRGDDGLDELTTTTTSHACGGCATAPSTEHVLDPARLGIARRAGARRCAAATPRSTPTWSRGLLAGEPGPVRDAVLLNAAAALVALGDAVAVRGADDLDEAMAGALATAAAAVDSGAAAAALERWVAASAALAPLDRLGLPAGRSG